MTDTTRAHLRPGRFIVLARLVDGHLLADKQQTTWLRMSRQYRTPRAAQRKANRLHLIGRLAVAAAPYSIVRFKNPTPWAEFRVIATDGVMPDGKVLT